MLAFHLRDRMLGERTILIRPHSLVSSEISPHGYMPRLRIRQRWTTYQVSPLRPPTSPQGTIVATVERYDPMIWNGKLVETLLVVYRKDEGSGSRSADEYLGANGAVPLGVARAMLAIGLEACSSELCLSPSKLMAADGSSVDEDPPGI